MKKKCGKPIQRPRWSLGGFVVKLLRKVSILLAFDSSLMTAVSLTQT